MNEDEHSPYFVNEPTPTAAEFLLSVMGVVVLILYQQVSIFGG